MCSVCTTTSSINPYTYKKSKRARNIRITVRRSGEVVVTMPRLVPHFVVERFVVSKQEWIENKVAEFAAHKATINPDAGKYGTGTRKEFLAQMEHGLAMAAAEQNFTIGVSIATAAQGLHVIADGLIQNWLLDATAFDLVASSEQIIDTYLTGLGFKIKTDRKTASS